MEGAAGRGKREGNEGARRCVRREREDAALFLFFFFNPPPQTQTPASIKSALFRGVYRLTGAARRKTGVAP